MAKVKIGITERGDPSIDFSWKDKIEKMNGAVFITKNLTDKLIDETKPFWNKIIFHVTCTGYGQTVVEPNIPLPDHQLSQAKKMVDAGFPIERIVIRIDPIIPTTKGIEKAYSVLTRAFTNYGFKRFRISIIDMYPHVRKRFESNNLPVPYNGNFSPSKENINAVNKFVKTVKNTFNGISVECCAEKNLTNAEQVGCISKKDFDLLGLELEDQGGGYQRSGCLCCSAKTEMLSEKKRCPYKCLYCYWKEDSE